MADDTIDLPYAELCQRVAGGTPHYSDRWSEWFGAAQGDTLEDRVRAAFTASGHLPTPPQLDAAREIARRVRDAAEADGEES